MSDNKRNKVASANVRLSGELLKELRKEAARYGAKGEEPPAFGAMLEQAWRESRKIPDAESTKTSNLVSASVVPYESLEAAETLNPSGSPPKTARSQQTELGVELWVNMLRYILEFGDRETQEAITKNLERFHLLARLLRQGAVLDERPRPEISNSPPDLQESLDRVRALEQEHLGGRRDPRKAETGAGGATESAAGRTGKRRKH